MKEKLIFTLLCTTTLQINSAINCKTPEGIVDPIPPISSSSFKDPLPVSAKDTPYADPAPFVYLGLNHRDYKYTNEIIFGCLDNKKAWKVDSSVNIKCIEKFYANTFPLSYNGKTYMMHRFPYIKQVVIWHEDEHSKIADEFVTQRSSQFSTEYDPTYFEESDASDNCNMAAYRYQVAFQAYSKLQNHEGSRWNGLLIEQYGIDADPVNPPQIPTATLLERIKSY